MIELKLADGTELDIPDESILLFEEMDENTNPNFPTAKCFVMYLLGAEVLNATLETKYDDVLFETQATSNPRWLRLTIDDGRRVGVLSHSIVSRKAVGDGCEIVVLVGRTPQRYLVKESRRQIKKWTEKSLAPSSIPSL